jgi:hypothetical protein
MQVRNHKILDYIDRLDIYRYQNAIKIYEDIAQQSLNNNLLKYGVRGYLLNSGLCELCKGDIVAITNALERYQVLFNVSSWYWSLLLYSHTFNVFPFHRVGLGSNIL